MGPEVQNKVSLNTEDGKKRRSVRNSTLVNVCIAEGYRPNRVHCVWVVDTWASQTHIHICKKENAYTGYLVAKRGGRQNTLIRETHAAQHPAFLAYHR